MQQKLQQAYTDNQQALQKLQQEKMQPLVTKIQKAIENVGKAGNYVYIMDVSLGIPYISSTLSTDVTAAIKAEMKQIEIINTAKKQGRRGVFLFLKGRTLLQSDTNKIELPSSAFCV